MRTTFTIQDILNSPCGHLNQHLAEKKPGKKKRERKVSKEKTWIQFKLEEFATAQQVVLQTELMFHPERKWRFDWAYPEIKVAFEYEGIFSEKSRHTTVTGFSGDSTKYNAAAGLGWKVYRYTALNYTDLVIDLSRLKI